MTLNRSFVADLDAKVAQLKADRVHKVLNHLDSPQSARVTMEGRGEVLILSSNNYVGLCDEPSVIQAGGEGLRRCGAGTASVRFICGTFTVHRELERACARFVGTPSPLSFVSAWNANAALTTAVYRHGDLDDLVAKLRAATGAKRRLIWTDGVFSMEGSVAKIPQLLQVARDHDAVLIVDDSHATGVMGATGRGTAEHFGVLGKVDVITSTLGKALGGAAGGFVAGPASLTD